MKYDSKHIFFIFLLSVLIIYGGNLRAQPEMSMNDETRGPNFHLDLVNLAVPEKSELSRLNLFIEIVYDQLQFIRVADGFEANYEISAVINDDDDHQVDGKIWSETIFVADYDQTNSRHSYHFSKQQFDLEAGKYKVVITAEDSETGRSESRKASIELRDFVNDKLSLSDVTLTKNIEIDSIGIKSIWPQVSDRLKGIEDNTFAYFEIYNPKGLDKVEIEYKIEGEHSKTVVEKQYEKQLTGERTLEYIMVPGDSLKHDSYRLKITVEDGKDKYKIEKRFYVRWKGLPTTTEDLDTAIEQLRYIAVRDEWKVLKKAKGNKKLVEFISFWKRHDPTPGTEVNEAMEIHYTRVEYANRNFSAMQRPGWRTDMGMVFIIIGSPDDVERNAYPRYSKPYEIWYYYRYNRQFLFYDATGFGDFRLDSPFSIYEFQRLIAN